MIELYLDTVDVKQVERLSACLPIKGVTTNPSILAKAGIGINQVLPKLADILGNDARFHLQVVSQTVDGIIDEANQINALPYDMVVKISATEGGLIAIKLIKQEKIKVLATAIYSAQQGICAALCGADYLAPYVNRMDSMGCDGVGVVGDLQQLITQQGLNCKVLPASFKNTWQVMSVMKLGVQAITLPVDIAAQMINHQAAVYAVYAVYAVEQFNQDWHATFESKLSFQT